MILGGRQPEFCAKCKGGTFPRHCSTLHLATMKLDQLARYDEPEPGSSVCAGAAGVNLAEGFEDHLSFLLGKASACINNRELKHNLVLCDIL